MRLTDEDAVNIHAERFKEIADETATLKGQRGDLSNQLRNHVQAFNRLQNAEKVLDQSSPTLTEWKEEVIRQLVHTVKVISADRIQVY